MSATMNSILGIPNKSNDFLDKDGMNLYVLGLLVIVICVYYIFFSRLAINVQTGEKTIYIRILEILLWSVFIVLVILNGMQYFFNMNVTTSISNILSGKPIMNMDIQEMPNFDGISSKQKNSSLDLNDLNSNKDLNDILGISNDNSNNDNNNSLLNQNDNTNNKNNKDLSNNDIEYESGDTVFHVTDNKYTYEDSKAICKAFESRLATYNELEEAYDKGGGWCGYGWSEGQMALYPTQKKHFEQLQKIKGHENDCGRSGINGGFIANPNVRFGVNCFGKRPKQRDVDKRRMENTTLYPKTKAEIEFEKNVESWKEKIPDMVISPYSYEKWS